MKLTLTTPTIPTNGEMQNNFAEDSVHESTYALLVRSEEKPRTVIETVIYLLFVFSAVAAIWQFVHQPIGLPITGVASVAESAIGAPKHHVSKPNAHG
jgi:hypothetical protein